MTDLAKQASLRVQEPQPTIQLRLENGVLGRQVFVPRQQLLVYRPRHVGQDTRPIHKRPLPYTDSTTASWTVREFVLSRLRNYYRRRLNHCSPAGSVFWPYAIGNIPPAEAEEHYYATLDQPAMAA